MTKHLKRILRFSLLSFIIASTAVSGMEAKKISTKLRAPAYDATALESRLRAAAQSSSGFRKTAESLTFMAYDKKASADKETFFVDNGSAKTLSSLEVEISYFTESNKLIHRRTVKLDQPFPAKETRRVDIPSWDKQKSFHYINSVPASKGSTPYKVRFKVLQFVESGNSAVAP